MAAVATIGSARAFGGIIAGYKYVYYQADDGSIKQKRYNYPDFWTDQIEIVSGDQVLVDTPIATAKWMSGNSSNFRVYYLSPDHEIREWCYDSGGRKYQGALSNLNIRVADVSKLSVIRFKGQLRIYYQAPSGDIEEYCYSDENSWTRGSTLPGSPLWGTSLAFINRNDEDATEPSIRGYFQTTGGEIQELYWEPGLGWSHDITLGWGQLGTAIAAATKFTGSAPEIDVYWFDENNYILNSTNHYGPSWSTPTRIDWDAAPEGSKLDAKAVVTDGQIEVGLWCSRSHNQIAQRRFYDGKWQGEVVLDI